MVSGRLFAVVTGGGTAGHLSPALAVAEALVAAGHEPAEIEFAGSRRGIESRFVPAAGFVLHELPGRGIRRSLSPGNLSAAAGLAVACTAAVAMAARRRPRVVVTVGGYAGLAFGVAAVALRIPLVVVDVDSVPGATNRLLGRFASARTAPFEGAGARGAVVTGAPVRRSVLVAAQSGERRSAARSRLSVGPGRLLLVVAGGSLGARSINRAVLALARLWARREDVAIYHLAGERNLAEVRAAAGREGLAAAGPGLQYLLCGYDPDLPEVLAAADLAVCRAGASTIAELTVIGVPSILVPLPRAPSDHQTLNARLLADRGAARLLPDELLDGERLAAEVEACLRDESLERMAESARSLGRRDAAERVARVVEGVAAGGRGGSS